MKNIVLATMTEANNFLMANGYDALRALVIVNEYFNMGQTDDLLRDGEENITTISGEELLASCHLAEECFTFKNDGVYDDMGIRKIYNIDGTYA